MGAKADEVNRRVQDALKKYQQERFKEESGLSSLIPLLGLIEISFYRLLGNLLFCFGFLYVMSFMDDVNHEHFSPA